MWSSVATAETRIVLLSDDDANSDFDFDDFQCDDQDQSFPGGYPARQVRFCLGPPATSAPRRPEETPSRPDIPGSGRPPHCPLKGVLKKKSSLRTGRESPDKAKKRVRWSDTDAERKLDLKSGLRSIRQACAANRRLIFTAVMLTITCAFASWAPQVAFSDGSKGMPTHLRLSPQIPFLRFHYNSESHQFNLILDDRQNVVFDPQALADHSRQTFRVEGSSILVRRPGVYLVVLHYEHHAPNVTVQASLPVDESGTRPFLMSGLSDSLYHECVVREPQRISVAVQQQQQQQHSLGLPGPVPASASGFKSLLLEVTQLGGGALPSDSV